jgi:hypothetical protein
MASVITTTASPRMRGARGATAGILVGGALALTFVAGRWSAAEPRTDQQLRPPAVVQLSHHAPVHHGTVKEG